MIRLADRPEAGAGPVAQKNDMATPRRPVHLLSFDVEEYFQVEGAAAGVARQDWPRIAKRLPAAVDRVLGLLAEHDASATFFVLGWVAQHERALVERIAGAGHEIASHGMDHRMLTRLGPEAFRRDLAQSRRLLQDLSGRDVIGYRAPTFSIFRRTAWALDVLAEEGFQYDSSVFPIRHDRYGVRDAPAGPHRAVGPGGGTILEVPPLTFRLLGINWPFGGGGYLRLLPARAVGAALRSAARRGHPGMIYLHPWEMDPDQPVLPMGRLSHWRHRLGLKRTEKKLRALLGRFSFGAVREELGPLAQAATETFSYAEALPDRSASAGG
jgi:polysaccharide deacetylase family protein (PEP-CTERM system associated)